VYLSFRDKSYNNLEIQKVEVFSNGLKDVSDDGLDLFVFGQEAGKNTISINPKYEQFLTKDSLQQFLTELAGVANVSDIASNEEIAKTKTYLSELQQTIPNNVSTTNTIDFTPPTENSATGDIQIHQ